VHLRNQLVYASARRRLMDYCTCKFPPGYLSLRDELNTFVCGACLKPAYLVWLASEKFCEECGCSIYSPWELICSPCQTDLLELATDLHTQGIPPQEWPPILTGTQRVGPWLSWQVASERSRATYPMRWESHAA
jgi:hypothetical protein